jgi:hypothetical protein
MGFLEKLFGLNQKEETFMGNNIYDFNCQGFAFGTYQWDYPYDLAYKGVMFTADEDNYYLIDEYLDITVNWLLNYYSSQLRVIDNVKEIEQGEEVIAYRVGAHDFHFMKRKSNGKWYHKPGASPVQSVTQKEVFSKVWKNRSGTTYTSELVLFAFKKGE